MNRVRLIRAPRRGLNPAKAVFVYGLAFILVAFHQSGRVADWFENFSFSHEGRLSEISFNIASTIRTDIQPYGPRQLNAIEDWLLGLFYTPEGAGATAARGSAPEDPPVSEPTAAARPPKQPSAPDIISDPLIMHTREGEAAPPPDGLPYAELPPVYWAPDATAPKPPKNNAPPESASDAAAGKGLDVPPAANNNAPAGDSAGPAQNGQTTLAGLPPNGPGYLRRPIDTGASEKEPPAKGDASVFNPARVLLLGDSMMLEGLGPPLQRSLKQYEGLTVFRDGRYGTGLTRLDNFDWLTYFDETLQKYSPDLVILTLGANDPQDMVDTGKRVHLGSDVWNENYAARVADLLARAEKRGARVFWVGLPIMGREPYGGRIEAINKITAETCQAAPNCRFWNSWLSVADAAGRYTVFIKDAQGKSIRVRSKDNIHLTEAGGRMMAEKFLAETKTWADYAQKPGAGDGAAAVEEAPAKETEPGRGNAQPQLSGGLNGSAGNGLDSPLTAKTESTPPLAPSAGDGDDEAGFIERKNFHSKIRGKDTAYYLARPGGRASGPKSLPVIFLLHGAWDGYDAWVKKIGPESLAAWAERFGLILVMADGEPFGWYIDGREEAIESFFIKELLPEILAKNPKADPERVGLLGLSMGGHGALTFALKHPDKFKAVGVMSAVTDLSAHAGGRHAVDKQLGLEKALGPAGDNGANWRPYGAAGLLEKNPSAWGARPLIIGCGDKDALVADENENFHKLLSSLGIEHTYRQSPGAHGWNYWKNELPVQLEFLSKSLGSGPAANIDD